MAGEMRWGTGAKGVVTIEQIVKHLGLPEWEAMDEAISQSSTTYGDVYREMIGAGTSEEEAESLAIASSDKERDEEYRKWLGAVEYVFSQLLEYHHLALEPVSRKEYESRFKYEPEVGRDWVSAAQEIARTIRGVGDRGAASLPEMMAEEGILDVEDWVHAHIWNVSSYAAVLGSANRMFRNQMRD